MNSQANSVDARQAVPDSRSWWLEILGLISILGFFIGIGWAMYTQFNGTVSKSKFEAVQIGQTLAQVEDIMGNPGIKADQPNAKVDGDLYTWENSTDSMVTVVFVNGKVVSMSAKNLP